MMKTIGMLGGMSWESTATYYRLINEGVKARLGGLHSARIALVSVDFHEIERLQHKGDWDGTAKILIEAARQLKRAGAEFLLICTNTMHRVAPQIEAAVELPLLHIADATAEQLKRDGVRRVGLLGTRFTMEQDFYKSRLQERFDIDVTIPDQQQRELIHRVIYEELCVGVVREESRNYFLDIINSLYAAGAKSVILGCTEIALLLRQEHTSVYLYDTTALHCQAAVNLALDDTDSHNRK